MPRVIACLPVQGRRPLLSLTIERLFNKNKVWKVICVGDDPEDKQVCELNGAQWVNCENYPLSRKWNRGFFAASMYDPDYYLFVGSSDFISDNWIPAMIEHANGHDMVGKRDMYLYDHGPNKRICHWPGYTGVRAAETIGIGRLLSARVMEKMNYAPFAPWIHNSMDSSMQGRVETVGGKIKVVEDDNIKSLSISCSVWVNKHSFEDHWSGALPSRQMNSDSDLTWLLSEFPEIKRLP